MDQSESTDTRSVMVPTRTGHGCSATCSSTSSARKPRIVFRPLLNQCVVKKLTANFMRICPTHECATP